MYIKTFENFSNKEKTVIYNNKKYYVDGLSGDIKALMDKTIKERKQDILFQEPDGVRIYFHKNFLGNPDYLSDAVDILKNIKQPTDNQVRNAMIWGLGYPNEGLDYAIKSGGESHSDSMFSSHLRVMVAHPTTGLDTNLVVLKKYGKEVSDVYITEKEVRDLYDLCKTPEEDFAIKSSKIESGIILLWRSFLGRKIDISGKFRLATEGEKNMIKKYIHNFGNPKIISNVLAEMALNRTNDSEISKELIKFKEYLFNTSENLIDTMTPPPPPVRTKRTGDDDEDGDKSLSYYSEWLEYWIDNTMPHLFYEVMADERYRKNIDNIKDTESFNFYAKLWYEHKYDHSFIKKDIEKEIIDYINHYNSTVAELDRQRDINNEIEDIMNTHEEDFGDITLRYKLEKPSKARVNRFIKNGESQEDANKKLFSVLSLEGTNEPEDVHSEEWELWTKNVYNPFFEKEIVPYVEKNNWRLWSY